MWTLDEGTNMLSGKGASVISSEEGEEEGISESFWYKVLSTRARLVRKQN